MAPPTTAPRNVSPAIPATYDRLLRLGLAACFCGHGAFALQTHLPWFGFYRALGLDDEVARLTMPVVGALDLVVAALLVFASSPQLMVPLLAWAAAWTIFTALLRPLAGLGVEEVLVRGTNWGPALALLALRRGGAGRAVLVLAGATLAVVVGAALGARVVPATENPLAWLERAGLVTAPAACLGLGRALVRRLRP